MSAASVDVVVVGGGSAALCAAIAARRAGASVRLLEQAPRWMRGGNTRHARNFRLMHDQPATYVPDSYSEKAFLKDLVRVTGDTDPALAELLVRGSASIAQWLQDNGVQLQDPSSGAMPYSSRTAFALGGGKAMINALYATAERLGIALCYDSEVVALRGGNRQREIDVVHGGATATVVAKAVVVCSGGHQADPAWLRQSFGDAADAFVVRGSPYVTGSVLRLLLAGGARPIGDPAICHLVAVDARGPKYDGGIVTRITAIPHGLVVDRNGRRFHDEGEDARKTHFARWGARIANLPGQIGYLVLDAAGRARALPTAMPPVAADSVAGLAIKLELDPAALRATIDGFNAAIVATGTVQHTIGLAPPKSHGAVALNIPPFFGYPMRPGITFTHHGVAVDRQMRVLDTDGAAADNLFAAGMIMAANVLRRGYLAGLGVTICTVSGRIAGEQAAQVARN